MSSFVCSGVRSVAGKMTRSALDTRSSRPPASTMTSPERAMAHEDAMPLPVLAERHGIALRICDRRDPLSPWHVPGLAQDRDPRAGEPAHHAVKVGDVDVHLEARAVAHGESVAVGSP